MWKLLFCLQLRVSLAGGLYLQADNARLHRPENKSRHRETKSGGKEDGRPQSEEGLRAKMGRGGEFVRYAARLSGCFFTACEGRRTVRADSAPHFNCATA